MLVPLAGFHASGLYKNTPEQVSAQVDALLRAAVPQSGTATTIPVSYGFVTEMYASKFMKAFEGKPGNWKGIRLGDTDAGEMVLMYDNDVLDPIVPSVRPVRLSNQRLFTEKGTARPLTTMLEAMFAHAQGGVFTAQGGHWSLANTANRVKSWGQESATFKDRANDVIDVLEAQIVHTCDLNRDLKTASGRALFHKVYAGTPMRSAWNLNDLPKVNTHGKRIIDVALSNMAILRYATTYPAGKGRSDHTPIVFAHRFDTTKGLAPRRVAEPGKRLAEVDIWR